MLCAPNHCRIRCTISCIGIALVALSLHGCGKDKQSDPQANRGWATFDNLELAAGQVLVEVSEGIANEKQWPKADDVPAGIRFETPALCVPEIPRKYTNTGVIADRRAPIMLRAKLRRTTAAGTYRVLLRSTNAARLSIDGKVVAETNFLKPSENGFERVPQLPPAPAPGIKPVPAGHQERIVSVQLEAGEHEFRLEAIAGTENLRPSFGGLCAAISRDWRSFELITPDAHASIPLTEQAWDDYVADHLTAMDVMNFEARRTIARDELAYWEERHQAAKREVDQRPPLEIPDVANSVPVNNAIDQFIGAHAMKANTELGDVIDDDRFLRRVTLDLAGTIPTHDEITAFFADKSPQRREKVIDRLLSDRRWADHWVAYWQEVLAENPSLVNHTANMTGPFRYWMHESFVDNKPMDRFVTELITMDGSVDGGGPAGFGLAKGNDAPMAAKAHVLSKAFLGLEMKCARCHDAPERPFKQRQLFEIAAMLHRTPITVPGSSTLSARDLQVADSLETDVRGGERIAPRWPFADESYGAVDFDQFEGHADQRKRLALAITSPTNRRFAEVIVNRVWRRHLGWGLVDPVDDWHDPISRYPQLLEFLAREFVSNNYDLKHIVRLILSSHIYQRSLRHEMTDDVAAPNFWPVRRRMTAEQLVDSLFLGVGKHFHTERITYDPAGRRELKVFRDFGEPQRAWQFANLCTDSDRPSISLPRARSIMELMKAYGWRESRADSRTEADDAPFLLQPLLLANGTVGRRIATLSDDGAITELCLGDVSMDDLIQTVYLRLLSRPPSDAELDRASVLLSEGYSDRRRLAESANSTPITRHAVTWSNRLSPAASRIVMEADEQASRGDTPTARLRSDWRERMEDVIWALANSPEFILVP